MKQNEVSPISTTLLSVVAWILVVISWYIFDVNAETWFHSSNFIGILNTYSGDILPANYTFAIWYGIVLWQAVWMCYVLYCFIRNDCTDAILIQSGVCSTKFQIFFTVSCIGIVLWFLMIRNELIMLSAIYILGVSICGIKAISINSEALLKYEKALPPTAKNNCIVFQLLVQNGLDFLFSWTTILSIVCISCAFGHDPLLDNILSPHNVDTTCLVLLGILTIVCSISENIYYYESCKYIYSWYVVLIWAMAGILVRQLDNGGIHNFILTVAVLCVSIMCFFAKIIFLIVKSTPKSDPLVDPILSTDV